MKYTAILKDKDYNKINSFWFRSNFGTSEMENVWEAAKNIAKYHNYKFDNLSVHPKED
jgi:hypothetical protein